MDAQGNNSKARLLATLPRWIRYVRAALVGAVGPTADIEDLMQDVFLAVWRAASRQREIRNPKAYFAAAVGSVAHRYARRRANRIRAERAATREELLDRLAHDDPSTPIQQRELVEQWLSRLPCRERYVVEAYHCRGMTRAEIGDALRLPRTTVNELYARGMNKLRGMAERDACDADARAGTPRTSPSCAVLGRGRRDTVPVCASSSRTSCI
jgi:RNA polymerase sigma factor (sigma-70 family)